MGLVMLCLSAAQSFAISRSCFTCDFRALKSLIGFIVDDGDESEGLDNGSNGLYYYEIQGLPEEEPYESSRARRVKFSTSPIVVCDYNDDVMMMSH